MKVTVEPITDIRLQQVDPLDERFPEHTVLVYALQHRLTATEARLEAPLPYRAMDRLLIFRPQELRSLCRQLSDIALPEGVGTRA